MAIINRLRSGSGGAAYADASFQIALELAGDWTAEAGAGDAIFDGEIDLGGDWVSQSYNPYADTDYDGDVLLSGDWTSIAVGEYADDDYDGDINLSGDWSSEAYTPGDEGFEGVINLGGDWEMDAPLALADPAPLLRTISATAFQNQQFAGGGGRLFVNNVETNFIRAEINAPSGAVGKTIAIELAKADLEQLVENSVFKFEIGKIVSGSPVWETIVDGAKLVSRNFQMASGRNGLSISVKEASSKLDKFPKNNLIVFDAAKAEVSTEEIEPLPTNTNEFVTTTARSVNVLTLKKLLDIAFVEGCGFASVLTDIPNYEIARCDFSVTNSYLAAVAQFLGQYEPDFRVEGNNLLIQKNVNPLPLDYVPNSLYANRYPNFSEALDNALEGIDGYVLQYTARAGEFYADRNLPTLTETSGTFGETDFTETTIARKMRDWFEPDNPVAVRSELKQETREIRRSGILIGRETKINTFDRLSRPSGYTNTVEARMPDVMNGDAPSLLLVREESQKINFKTNPFAPRQTYPARIETASRALLAIDSDNTALDENGEDAPYGQDYERVFEAGNLKSGMTSEFRTLEVNVDSFRPLQNGQVEVRQTRFDALRGKMKPTVPTDVRSGDISVLNFQKQQTKTIFKIGVNQATRTDELKSLNAGELPLVFAEPMANWLLANPPISGNVEVAGFDSSVERGVSFKLRGRSDEDLGNFKINGYRVVVEPKSVMTVLEARKV